VPDTTDRVRHVLVSRDARVLDPAAYEGYLRRVRIPLPVVVGVRARPPSRPGQHWTDLTDQVAEGLAAAEVAARLYRDLRGRRHVLRIGVSRFPAPPQRRGGGEVRLTLDDGTSVEWGRTERDLEGVASEYGYDRKQWRLESQLDRGPHTPGATIDVRFRLPGETGAARFSG
jgi:hypothetical protein